MQKATVLSLTNIRTSTRVHICTLVSMPQYYKAGHFTMNKYSQKELLLALTDAISNENTKHMAGSITYIHDYLPETYMVYSTELYKLSNDINIPPIMFKVLVSAMSTEAGTTNKFIINEILIHLFGYHVGVNDLYTARTNRLLEYIHESRPDIVSSSTIDLTTIANLTKDSPYSKVLNTLIQVLIDKPQLSFTLDNIKRNRLIAVIGASLPGSTAVNIVDLIEFINTSLNNRLDLTLGELNPYKGIVDIVQTSNTSQLQSIITMISGLVITAADSE